MQLQLIGAMLLATGTFVTAQQSASPSASSPSSTSSSILAVQSPTWLPKFSKPAGVNDGYTGKPNITDTLPTETLDLSAYPEPWSAPVTDHPEIQAVMKAIDWNHVPKSSIKKDDSNGDISFSGYDESKDPDCWWSDTNCIQPKVPYLPQDVVYCPNVGDWGLNYDDGPMNPNHEDGPLNDDKWAEPELYNFLAKNNNQKATLFYIGSNVVTFPAAARRALNDGHVLCVHTWSHPQMTTQSNEKVVAELYWTLRAIKEATGVTPRCWRPPFGDVDDRVRAIAWQMGMRTMLWDEDTDDWNMPGDGGGDLAPSTVDGYFEDWINKRKNGTDNEHGHIVLEHELNNSTVSMTEKWLPKLQETFNVVSMHQCLNISQPYWEENWVYPTEANPDPAQNNNSNNTASSSSSSTSPSSSSSASDSSSSEKASSESSKQLSSSTDSPSDANSAASSLTLSLATGIVMLGTALSLTL
ncbi:uncharacterized protein BYT42DRAFT_551471 [Radiomyces spectabilis]|uniref:uncharacterized protein n=1 Tax=Radiomyces spectabilis TaxID=64574 RepID=UPI00221EB6E1|nr:uncharacterized protein BYT42DRAFT_551471 [Radiomyces spectabilis]KAI8393562.1 hypothetical protein BYT42DRAFT_551471 [Radiomyces spectabilis]